MEEIIVLGVAIGVPVIGVIIYAIRSLLDSIYPNLGSYIAIAGIIIGYILYLRWWYRQDRKRKAERNEGRRRREEEREKYENRDFSEDEISKMVDEFLKKGGQKSLRIKLRRDPTYTEIREAAVENAVAEFLVSYKAFEKALHAASTSNRFF